MGNRLRSSLELAEENIAICACCLLVAEHQRPRERKIFFGVGLDLLSGHTTGARRQTNLEEAIAIFVACCLWAAACWMRRDEAEKILSKPCNRIRIVVVKRLHVVGAVVRLVERIINSQPTTSISMVSMTSPDSHCRQRRWRFLHRPRN